MMNNKEEEKWLKVLRKRMEDCSEPLPEGLWEELEGDLNQPKVIPLWRRWPAVAAAVALVLIVNSLLLSYWFTPLFEEEVMQQAQQFESMYSLEGGAMNPKVEADDKVSKGDSVAPRAVASLANAESEPASSKRVSHVALSDVTSSDITVSSEVSSSYDTTSSDALASVSSEVASVTQPDSIPSELVAQANQKEEEPKTYPQYRATTRTSTRTRTSYSTDYQLKRRKKRYDRDVQLGLHTGGLPYGVDKGFEGMTRLTCRTNEMKVPVLMGDMTSPMTPYNQVLFSNRNQDTYTKVDHHMPINVTASVKWNVSEKWALETGITYTYLESDLHSGANFYWEDNQKLHYLGIPLKVHRSIWSNSLLGLYASAGGTVEKCISGTLKSEYVTNHKEKKLETSSIDEHPFQVSLMASLGAQINFIKQLSLFVEPGIAYYFDDGSSLSTIRKEHPFNFNLQFGLRLNLRN